jgi:enterochelin esterase-like enzyme
MWYRNLLLLIFFFAFHLVFAQLPQVSSGKIQRFENFSSSYVPARTVDVWLPATYNSSKKYAVLYMHDGQMLFDAATTWNKQEWGVDEVITRLLEENKVNDVIVVGVWNGDKRRHPEYFPQKPFEALSQQQKDTIYKAARANGFSVFNDYPINSDNYLKFLVKELKPFIDQQFSTYRDKQHTFIAGSSMGGLISMYALCEYPNVFGGAACLSTHWPGIFTMEGNPIPQAFINYLDKNLPNLRSHKIYFDYGDQTLDALYPPLQHQVDVLMKTKPYSTTNWMTRFFPGQDHSEKSWRSRLDVPLLFLLSKSSN